MKFVEGDIIHEENWYHGACLKIKNKSADICIQSKYREKKYPVLD